MVKSTLMTQPLRGEERDLNKIQGKKGQNQLKCRQQEHLGFLKTSNYPQYL